ncbi:MAG TPA: FAD-binding oxidoreductase [Candidatus Limnocylindrales bacterium]|nr:FAD-binding oxidoreductase [Candidatus Limnocylindrales bacterium]
MTTSANPEPPRTDGQPPRPSASPTGPSASPTGRSASSTGRSASLTRRSASPNGRSSWTRILSSPWLSPLNDTAAIDDLLGLVDPTWSVAAVRARVVSVNRETDDASTLVLRPNRLWLGHVAGQHVQLTVETGGRRHVRTFSISSPPRADGLVHVTVKRRAGGKVSSWLADSAAAGDVVTLSNPAGDFVLPPVLPPRIVLVSAGSGITPVMALLRTIVEAGGPTDVLFVHTSRSRRDVIFAHELETIARTHPRIEIRLHLTEESGRLDAAQISSIAAEAAGAPAFVCGPESFMTSVRSAWGSAGNAEHLRFEWFGAPARENIGGEAQSISAEHSGTRFTALAGQSLLVAAENAGLRPLYGCRIGVCHTCKCHKISGVTEDLRDGRISDEPGEMIQLCISTARSDVSIEI